LTQEMVGIIIIGTKQKVDAIIIETRMG